MLASSNWDWSGEFMLPLGQSRTELVLALLGALSELESGELGVFQVIFEGVRRPWGASTLAAVSDGGGGSFFVNAPEFVPAAKKKVSRPLFATVVRVATRGADPQRASTLLDQVLGGFAPFADDSGNRLIPPFQRRLRNGRAPQGPPRSSHAPKRDDPQQR
jgi:hypothetical protein